MSRPQTVPPRRSFRPVVTNSRRAPDLAHEGARTGPAAAELATELAAAAAVLASRVPVTRTSASLSGRWNSPPLSQYKQAVLRPLRTPAPRPFQGLIQGLARVLLLASMAWSGLAYAQAPPAPSQGAKTKPTPPPGGKGSSSSGSPGGKKVISLDDEFLVEGKLEKPSAFYVLRRSSTDYDWARLDATMTPLVLESVWDPLF